MFVQQIRSGRVAREWSCPNGPFNEITGSVNITLNIASATKVTDSPMSECAPQSFGTL